MLFNNKCAIITGAAKGLGRSHVLDLAKRQIKGILINDFIPPSDKESLADLEKFRTELQDTYGCKIELNLESVCAEGAGTRIVEQAREAFGGDVHILINNAGIIRDRSFVKMTHQKWHQVVDVHLNGMFSVTHALWPHLVK